MVNNSSKGETVAGFVFFSWILILIIGIMVWGYWTLWVTIPFFLVIMCIIGLIVEDEKPVPSTINKTETKEENARKFNNEKSNDPITQLIEKYLNKLSDGKLFVMPNIPRDKLNNAISSYGNSIDPNEVIMLIDDTVMGHAKEGLLLTNSAIYTNEAMDNPASFRLQDIYDISREKRLIYINGKKFCKLILPAVRTIFKVELFLQEFLSTELDGQKIYSQCEEIDKKNNKDIDNNIDKDIIIKIAEDVEIAKDIEILVRETCNTNFDGHGRFHELISDWIAGSSQAKKILNRVDDLAYNEDCKYLSAIAYFKIVVLSDVQINDCLEDLDCSGSMLVELSTNDYVLADQFIKYLKIRYKSNNILPNERAQIEYLLKAIENEYLSAREIPNKLSDKETTDKFEKTQIEDLLEVLKNGYLSSREIPDKLSDKEITNKFERALMKLNN